MAAPENFDRSAESQRTTDGGKASDNLTNARTVDAKTVQEAKGRNSVIFKSMTDIVALGKDKSVPGGFCITDGDGVLASSTTPTQSVDDIGKVSQSTSDKLHQPLRGEVSNDAEYTPSEGQDEQPKKPLSGHADLSLPAEYLSLPESVKHALKASDFGGAIFDYNRFDQSQYAGPKLVGTTDVHADHYTPDGRAIDVTWNQNVDLPDLPIGCRVQGIVNRPDLGGIKDTFRGEVKLDPATGHKKIVEDVDHSYIGRDGQIYRTRLFNLEIPLQLAPGRDGRTYSNIDQNPEDSGF